MLVQRAYKTELDLSDRQVTATNAQVVYCVEAE